jgi:hypothetical protein
LGKRPGTTGLEGRRDPSHRARATADGSFGERDGFGTDRGLISSNRSNCGRRSRCTGGRHRAGRSERIRPFRERNSFRAGWRDKSGRGWRGGRGSGGRRSGGRARGRRRSRCPDRRRCRRCRRSVRGNRGRGTADGGGGWTTGRNRRSGCFRGYRSRLVRLGS